MSPEERSSSFSLKYRRNFIDFSSQSNILSNSRSISSQLNKLFHLKLLLFLSVSVSESKSAKSSVVPLTE